MDAGIAYAKEYNLKPGIALTKEQMASLTSDMVWLETTTVTVNGKTTTCANLGIGLAQAGKKVLLIDGDPQGSLTISLGNPQPDKLPFTLSDAMGKILMDQPIRTGEGILHHAEGIDLMPADIQLSGMEVSLVNAMSRETILRQYLDTLKGQYSHILIDEIPDHFTMILDQSNPQFSNLPGIAVLIGGLWVAVGMLLATISP